MRSAKFRSLARALGLVCAMAAPASFAAPVTVVFSGELELLVPGNTPLDSPQPFTVTLNYDDTAVGTTPVTPYEFRFEGIFTGQLALAGTAVALNTGLVVVGNDSPYSVAQNAFGIGPSPTVPAGADWFIVHATFDSAVTVAGTAIDGVYILLLDAEGTAFSANRLPALMPSLSTLEFAYVHMGAFDAILGATGHEGIDGPISSFSPAPVPLPASALLLGSALLWSSRFLRPFRAAI